MTTKIIIPCVISGAVEPTEFYVGSPVDGSSPIQFQAKWLGTAKHGSVPPHIMKALQDLYIAAKASGENFEELCKLAFEQSKEIKNNNNK